MRVTTLYLAVATLAAALLPGRGWGRETLVHSPNELHAAVAQAQPGDVILLADGEWRDVDLVCEARGTAEQPITIEAADPGRCVLTGTSRLRIAGEHLVVSGLCFRNAFHPDAVLEFRRDSKRHASHCRVTECAFIDCNPPPDSTEDAKYVSIYGHDNQFDHCLLSGKTSRGTTLVVWLADEASGGHQITANHFGPRPPLNRNGGETIRIGDSQTSRLAPRCIIAENLFERCSGEAEIISNKSCENVYRHNTFRGCGGALTLRHGHRCTVEGNWFFGAGESGTGGVRVIGAGHKIINNYLEGLTGRDARAALCLMNGMQDSPPAGYAPVEDVVIAHNTIIDCRQPLLIGYADKDVTAAVPPRNCLFVNNLITGPTADLITLAAEPRDFHGDGNLLFPAPQGISALRDLTAMIGDPHLTTADVGGGWRRADEKTILPGSATSARVDEDSDVYRIDVDIEGQLRDGKPDAGCDELSTMPPLFHPLTAKDVGPSWTVTP